MTFRTRLLLIFTIAVVASVALVEWLAIDATRRAFEQMEARRVDALVAQFRKEFARRGADIVRAVDGIAASDAAFAIASAPDPSAYYSEAAPMAAARGLALLELVADDGTIVSSAEWPARFGYKEDWLAQRSDWKAAGAFLRREELPEGMTLALIAVAAVRAGDRKLYVVGGQPLDEGFLSTLALPEGMRALLYRDLQARFAPEQLLGPGPRGPELEGFLSQVKQRRVAATRIIGAETFYAQPLNGYDGSPLGVLLIGSSREELMRLERTQRSYGLIAAVAGILIGMGVSAWATARVTRPVQRLAESAGKVAAGNWDTTVEEGSGDEVGRLARAFNRMTHELVEQRDRLVQAERVAAWRELARRLAHELKNPLFPLQITVENMQRARERSPEQFDEVFREGAHTLLAELANLKQIIGRFSDFAKMPAPQMQPVDFNALVSDTMRLFEAQFAQARVSPKLELDARLKPVNADAELMTRALRNLVVNAIDAMPEGGTLTVRTLVFGGGVRLEVSDTGQGLTPEECARLFTPYYTTKTHGTGLGLAIVQSVVSDHKGRIAVESERGKGATFRLDLG
ncbi:MAG TPA: ATP-binding protein [Bryobacteraceae bacterium]|nr:ATP-binding protein [Bryobacteraceae bacterium]